MLVPAASKEEAVYHGEVFTRRWVVDFMLDSANYTADRDLRSVRLVEPAAGNGAFVLPALERLSDSLMTHGGSLNDVADFFTAYELQERNASSLTSAIDAFLTSRGWDGNAVAKFAKQAVVTADFLLTPHLPFSVDVVVGNPPYIRADDLGAERFARYKAVSPAMVGRADIYIAFFDIAMDSLTDGGVCVFICADRWMRNDYGKALRKKVIEGYSMDLVLSMHEADAFEEEVAAYPAITVVRRGAQGRAVIATGDADFREKESVRLSKWMATESEPLRSRGVVADRISSWFNTEQSWPDGSPAVLSWLESLEESLPLVEETGIKFGIGVATGADEVYCVKDDKVPDIEPDRLLPLLVADDIRAGGVYTPTGTLLVNPWAPDGLVDLDDYPKLRDYFEQHPRLKERHTAKASPGKWWKTIDRVNFDILERPKLLFQDMKAETTPVLHGGGAYPHHNLYFAVATEDRWDLNVLGGLMLSKVFEAQVAAFCVKMRGNTLRFQTQYLRRVRVPAPEDISSDVQAALAQAFRSRDRAAATAASLLAYGMDSLPD